ncbi:3-isopropylmalate dehydratase small subunit [Verticiella sediminum]|uniref:3-isopropylmalate dehydratase small subunit n=1 Tax=Verticiella sediminum TaxID=1247510 RepID=A0A556AY19_9BURK|nr:3-isopropylmalate dehydratase small subunit [Verticiella sediminum]TSH97355.1 3-isopropylmalate dehydratase small subunit [Verticiella sediminum]
MKPFTTVRSRAIALDLANCDTDQIVPARYLSRPRAQGFAEALFHDLRHEAGREKPDFPLNRPEWRTAELLIAGENFGCGSSRESAVWALADAGIRAVIAPSFADIFFGNAFKNGLLPIVLPADAVQGLLERVQARPTTELTVALAEQSVTCPELPVHRFEIDPLRKHMLLEGLDEIGLTLGHMDAIAAFMQRYEAGRPWLQAPSRGHPAAR